MRRPLAVLLLAALIAGAGAAAWELLWRQQGYRPALYDDQDLWAANRTQVVAVNQNHNFVVAGASRIQLAFSTTAFASVMDGWTATSLAINGHYPSAVVADLATDKRFAGLLLVAIDARGLSHWFGDMSTPWVRHYRRDFGPQRWLERRALSFLQQRLVSAGSEFSLIRRIEGVLTGQSPPHHYTRLLPDRTIYANYQKADVTGLRKHFVASLAEDYRRHPAPSPDHWETGLSAITAAVQAIQARGGQVVFLRMPTADEHWALDREHYPREQYWNRLAEATGAVTLHFTDYPELAELELPDTSHIDGSDRGRFTRSLIDILTAAGVLPDN